MKEFLIKLSRNKATYKGISKKIIEINVHDFKKNYKCLQKRIFNYIRAELILYFGSQLYIAIDTKIQGEHCEF